MGILKKTSIISYGNEVARNGGLFFVVLHNTMVHDPVMEDKFKFTNEICQ
jgi:hypothetical protein